MKFQNVVIESIAYSLPPHRLTSADIERQLAPLYQRLKLPEGRLELMTGISERRYWDHGVQPSDASAMAGEEVLKKSSISRHQVECLIHSAVCRDFMEPGTASVVHRKLGLSPGAINFDVSNACLGFLNAMVLIATMIETGQIQCGMVVSGENGRNLVESTIAELLSPGLNRQQIKPLFASLTIGSGAVAAILTHRSLATRGHRLLGGASRAATQFNNLCQGDSINKSQTLMQTDSEQLLKEGVNLACETWQFFCKATGWSEATPDRFICHQVGAAHRKLLYERLGLDLQKDYSTFERLGNVGSVSLPITLAMAGENQVIHEGDKVALLGIGSGINCMMLAMEW